MIKSKNRIILTIFLTLSVSIAFSQEYLDSDKRLMKLTEVSTDKTYGFEIKNPIMVGTDEKAIGAYLNSLKPQDNDRIHIGDMKFDYKRKKGLTLVVLTFEQKNETATIYFSSTKFEQPKAIVGFSFKSIDDLPKVTIFPEDSIVKVELCTQTIYSVNDFLVKETFGENDEPSSAPSFEGGIDELKKYFAENPLVDEKATQIMFRVKIAYVVNCEGKAGNFKIVTKGKGDLATYANQVLAIVNSMPQKWEPATVDGKPVDCYQVLSFTALGGSLEKVSYR
jgi:hypothetical protein